MPQLSRDCIFVRQNFWIKTIILILGSLTAIVVPVKALYYLVIITMLYFLLSPQILRYMLRGFTVFLPFFATYSLLATVFGVAFPIMMLFMLRLTILIILMTYYSASLSIKRLIEDSLILQRYSVSKALIFFLIATLLFIKRIRDYYQSDGNVRAQGKNSVLNLIPNLIDAIESNWLIRDKIEAEAIATLSSSSIAPGFLNRSNLLGCIYLTYLVLILSI